MDLQLEHKTVFISGSTKGIGKATAETLAREGAQVIINSRTQDSVTTALKELNEAVPDGSFKGIACDFGEADEIKELIAQMPAIDILINNVGIFREKDFFDTTDDDWQEFYDVNVMSGVRLSRALMPKMLENNWGRIIFISSESALNIPEEMIHYGMTKTAFMSISRGLAELTTGTGVTVNSVLPGPTRTAGLEKNIPGDQTFDEFENKFFKNTRPTSINKYFADPKEVASMLTYLASPLSSGTNGSALRVDGGVIKSI